MTILRPLLVLILGVFLMGCGSSTGYKGPAGQVSGKISFDGKPVPPGSQVVFMAKEGTGYVASGNTNADGEYTLNFDGKTNVPAVAYLIQITPPAANAASASATKPQLMTPDQMAAMGKKSSEPPTPPPFPVKFGLTTTSKLVYEVKAGKNTADFDLRK